MARTAWVRSRTSNGVTCFRCSKARTLPAGTRPSLFGDCWCRSSGWDKRPSRWPACAPKTWRYLLRHAERLDRRASVVYRNQPRFSVFGVGPYTFCDWKVMVSGFYKSWRFIPVGPANGRPVLCDDTCYFLPCRSAAEARRRANLLNSEGGANFSPPSSSIARNDR